MTLRMYGATSGYVDIDVPAVAGSASVIFPATSGILATQIGYQLVQKIYYTNVGTSIFNKGNYSWLRAINVKVQGGGGGGRAGSTNNVHGGGGGAGGYSEKFITDIVSLPVSASVVVGSGGNGGSGSSGAAGGNGGQSIFNSIIIGNGGNTPSDVPIRGDGGTASGGDLNITGGYGLPIIGVSTTGWGGAGGKGGDSVLGFGGAQGQLSPSSVPGTGFNAVGYGGGGGGGTMNTTTYANGGSGSQGIVILELYA